MREGLSETEVDQTFFNPGERPVEGWYWFTVPERATITGFAVETDGVLVEGEFIEKKEAAAQYAAAKSERPLAGDPRVDRREHVPRADLSGARGRHAPRGHALHRAAADRRR